MTLLVSQNTLRDVTYEKVYTRSDGSVLVQTFNGVMQRGTEMYKDGTGRRAKPATLIEDPTPYTLFHRDTQPVKGTMTYVEYGYGTGVLTGDSLPVGADDFRITGSDGINKVNVDLVSQAEVKALLALRTHGRELEGTWDAGVAWGERAETARMLERAAQRVVNIAVLLRGGRWREANKYLPRGSRKKWKELKHTPYGRWLVSGQSSIPRRVLDALASGILEYQNGWAPLVADVHNATEALANRNQQVDWAITGKGKYERVLTEDRVIRQPNPWLALPSLRRFYEVKLGVFVRLDATVGDRFFETLAKSGLINPLALAYQLTPLSYLFDYFVAAGSWLESLDAAAGMEFLSGTCTRMYDKRVSIENAGGPGVQNFYGQQTQYELVRTVYSSFPFPIAPLSMKPNALSFRQLSNLTAVLYSLSRGLSVDYRA